MSDREPVQDTGTPPVLAALDRERPQDAQALFLAGWDDARQVVESFGAGTPPEGTDTREALAAWLWQRYAGTHVGREKTAGTWEAASKRQPWINDAHDLFSALPALAASPSRGEASPELFQAVADAIQPYAMTEDDDVVAEVVAEAVDHHLRAETDRRNRERSPEACMFSACDLMRAAIERWRVAGNEARVAQMEPLYDAVADARYLSPAPASSAREGSDDV